jgi:hypothetical protein
MSYIKADNRREQEYFDYLEELRRSGDTNMFGATPYLRAAFNLGQERAREVLTKWMRFHDDPKRILKKPLSKSKTEVEFVTEAKVSRGAR